MEKLQEKDGFLEGVKMVRMPHLLIIMVDLSSEICPVVVIHYAYDNETSFRSEIDHGGQYIWHYHHLHPLLSTRAPGGPVWTPQGPECVRLPIVHRYRAVERSVEPRWVLSCQIVILKEPRWKPTWFYLTRRAPGYLLPT